MLPVNTRRICRTDGTLGFNPVQSMVSELWNLLVGKNIILSIAGDVEGSESVLYKCSFRIENPNYNLGASFYAATAMSVDEAIQIMSLKEATLRIYENESTTGETSMSQNSLTSKLLYTYQIKHDLFGKGGINYAKDGGLALTNELVSESSKSMSVDIEDLKVPLIYVLSGNVLHGSHYSFFNVKDFGLWRRKDQTYPLFSESNLEKQPVVTPIDLTSPCYFFENTTGVSVDHPQVERVRITERYETMKIAAATQCATLVLTALHSELIMELPTAQLIQTQAPTTIRNVLCLDVFSYLEQNKKSGSPHYFIPVKPDASGVLHNDFLENKYSKIRDSEILRDGLAILRQIFYNDKTVYVTGLVERQGGSVQRVIYNEDYLPEDRNGAVSLAYALACCIEKKSVPSVIAQFVAMVHVSFNPRLISNNAEKVRLIPSTDVNEQVVDVPDMNDNLIKGYGINSSMFTRTGLDIHCHCFFTGYKYQRRVNASLLCKGDFVLLEDSGQFGVGYLDPNSERKILLLSNIHGLYEASSIDAESLLAAGVNCYPVAIEKATYALGKLSVARLYPPTLGEEVLSQDKFDLIPVGVY